MKLARSASKCLEWPTVHALPAARRFVASSSAQKFALTSSETTKFLELLDDILPPTDPKEKADFQTVRDALSLKTKKRAEAQERKLRTELTLDELSKLDQMREIIASFESEYRLLLWAIDAVFAIPPQPSSSTRAPTLFPIPSIPSPTNGTGSSSPIYAELLLSLFVHLRDVHHAPHSALYIFSLACSTPESYIRGCGTELWNEVLQTRWMEADFEGVAKGIEEMNNTGVPLNPATQKIVTDIGVAIRNDETKAERRLKKARETAMAEGGEEPVEEAVSERQLAQHRFFSSAQVAAWARMENVVAEHLDKAERKRRSRVDLDGRRRVEDDRRPVERESPSAETRTSSEGWGDMGMSDAEFWGQKPKYRK
ncbi:hypothetical protein MNV49_005250 [Pseudohyphozyma bogoriensis]|nr:hypothetical protein MNV49_005250 [Pseudohyphozyma bogoriensis]